MNIKWPCCFLSNEKTGFSVRQKRIALLLKPVSKGNLQMINTKVVSKLHNTVIYIRYN